MAYSSEQRRAVLAALKANDGNLAKTARETGVSIATVSRWRDAVYENESEKQDNTERHLTELIEDTLRAALGVDMRWLATRGAEPSTAEAKVASVMVGILADKWLALQGIAPGQGEHVWRIIDEREPAATAPCGSGGSSDGREVGPGEILRPGVWSSVGQDDVGAGNGRRDGSTG